MNEADGSSPQARLAHWRRERYRRALLSVLQTDDGRTLLYEHMRLHLLYTDIGAGDPGGTGTLLGRRAVALALRREIAALDPTLPARMELAAVSEQQLFEQSHEGPDGGA